jgi:hypothetical protein
MPEFEQVFSRLKKEIAKARHVPSVEPAPRRTFTFGVGEPGDLLSVDHDPVARYLQIAAEQEAKKNS